MSVPTFRSQAPWFLVLIAATLPSLASSQTDAETKKLTLEMYLDLESVSNPQISPDGARIVYTRGWVDKMNDRRESSIWIMNADGSKNHFLVDGSGPLWSPDGTRISYTASGEPEGSQIFVRWMDDEGATTQITRLEKGPGGITWSPDGKSSSFSMNVDGEPAWSVNPPGRPDGATRTEGPKVVTRADYRQDRQGFVDEGWQHVFVVPAEGGTPRQLTNGDWNHSTGRWTADGSELLFSSLRTEDSELSWRESEIYAVNVATEEIRQLTTRRGQDTGPLPSPRGDLIAYRGSDFNTDTYRNSGVYVMNLDGSGSRLISGDFDRNINSMEWAHDGSGVYVTISYQGARNVHFISVQGVVSEVTSGAHMLGLSSFTDQGFAVATLSGPQVPADIVSFDLDGPISFRQLTNVNDDIMAGVTLGDGEEIWYESLDGFQIQGWII